MKPLTLKPKTTPLPASIGQLIAGARQKLKQAIHAGMLQHQLTPQQFWMMLVLQEHGSMSLHRLAQRIFVDDPTASRLVKGMVDRGLVQTAPDPQHGRRIVITLGPKATDIVPNLQDFTKAMRKGMMEGLNGDEVEQLQKLLGKVLLNLDKLSRRYRDAADSLRKQQIMELEEAQESLT